MSFFTRVQDFLQWDSGQNHVCFLCGCDVFQDEAFCPSCQKRLPKNNVACARCGRALPQVGYCQGCKTRQPSFDKARSLYSYQGDLPVLIQSMKSGESALCYAFAKQAKYLILTQFSADVITFAPMTEEDEAKRGYNQSKLLATALGEYTHLPVLPLFEKKKPSLAQKGLSFAERQKNLQGTFAVSSKKEIQGKRILIVDDVLTTGATAEELTKLLKKAHADKVFVFTVVSVTAKTS